MSSRGADQAAQWFTTQYASAPEGVWHAPGRANLIGEHTDYNDGFVLPFALDRGTFAAAAPHQDAVLELTSRQAAGPSAGGAGAGGAGTGGMDRVAIPLDSLVPGSVAGWAAYPAGVVWALREAGYPVPGARVAVDSDLPQGAGLSSSAALECAVALALTQLAGLDVVRQELATIARRAENDFVGVPTGIMDQSAALLCQAGHALLLDCRSGEADSVPLDPALSGLALVIIDTRARHALTESGYGARHIECEEAARALGVRTLRDVAGPESLSALADPVLRRRARHVITENQRVLETAALLRRGQVDGIGRLLNQSHASLRDDFEISWPEADVAVDAAVGAGALGARMMGGGFGGSVIALLPQDGTAVHEAVRAAFRGQGWPDPGFMNAPPSSSARRLR
ncbi:MAG: galactokinase [Streptosporangiaceae bacterium]